uniref:Uncharacterized protein n=1 Tax=Meloidogyne incognita TaxID=6306 RepID=A0A914LX47_MELIC
MISPSIIVTENGNITKYTGPVFANSSDSYWTNKHNRIYIAMVFAICFVATIQITWLPIQISPSIIVTETGNITKYTGPVFANSSDSVCLK